MRDCLEMLSNEAVSLNYEEQLETKIETIKRDFSIFDIKNMEIFKSQAFHFRGRSEFRMFHDDEILKYAMFNNKQLTVIDKCSIVNQAIYQLMPPLLEKINHSPILKTKLFTIEFLSSSLNEVLVTLIYHRNLAHDWIDEAQKLEKALNISVIGRNRKQKIVLGKDYINEAVEINHQLFRFKYYEGGFTQPNTELNKSMISWVLSNIKESRGDLVELYCGGGNFTIPLSTKFHRVLATEPSKTSIKSARENMALNHRENITFVRLSSEEFTQALNKQRIFRRLKEIDLESFELTTIFVDPPRTGLDENTRELVKRFDHIIYISCNPKTLKRDLESITQIHSIDNFALFDQFPYTHHIESGVVLSKKTN